LVRGMLGAMGLSLDLLLMTGSRTGRTWTATGVF
jgi:hypothetical protein